MDSFEEILIREVYLRPCLYNKLHPDKKKRTMTNQAWKEISVKCEKSVDVCKKKWCNLRDQFFRHAKKMPSGSGNEEEGSERSTWQWYQQLLFLKEINTPLPTEDNFDEAEATQTQVRGDVQDQPGNEGIDGQLEAPDELFNSGSSSSSTDSVVAVTKTTEVNSVTFDGPQTSSLTQETPVQSISYVPHRKAKRPLKETIEEKWGKVIDKITEAATENHSVVSYAPDSSSVLFGKYLASEMEKMNESEQDKIKFSVFEAIQDVKRSRRT